MDYCGMVVTLSNLKTFNLWLKRQGVRLEGVKIALDPYGGAGVFATRDLSAQCSHAHSRDSCDVTP